MKNIINFSFFLLISIFVAAAQPDGFERVSDKSFYLQQMAILNDELISIKSEFEQTITSSLLAEPSVSSGVMYYKRPDKLRWEYQKPNDFIFILNEKEIFLGNEGATHSTKTTKMYNELSKMIISMITGEELEKERDFQSTFWTNGIDLWIQMTPKSRHMKQIYSLIELRLQISSMVAREIIFYAPDGDKTEIRFIDPQRNTVIYNSIFTLE